jgi:CcmD family protein
MTIPAMVPDTLDYMIAGYAVISVIVSSYIVSLIWRRKKIEQDLLDLQKEDDRN